MTDTQPAGTPAATGDELLLKLGVPDVQTAYEQAHQLGHRVWELAGDTEPDDPDAVSGSLLDKAAALLAPGADDVFCREQWAAALRYGAKRMVDKRDSMADDHLMLLLADWIESGVLTPWADTPAAAGGHPGTLDGPGVLGRALLDRDGFVWPLRGNPSTTEAGDAEGVWLAGREVTQRYGPVREVLLVDPAGLGRHDRLVDAAREWRVGPGGAEGHGRASAGLSEEERALVAAVDALDRPTAGRTPDSDEELPGMWERADYEGGQTDTETAPAVVRCACGVPIVHATPGGFGRDGCDDPVPADHQQLHEALAEAEHRAEAAEDRAETANAERQWAADGVCRRCGHGLSAAGPAPEPDAGTDTPAGADQTSAQVTPQNGTDIEPDSGPGTDEAEHLRTRLGAAEAAVDRLAMLLDEVTAERDRLASDFRLSDLGRRARTVERDRLLAERDAARAIVAQVNADLDAARAELATVRRDGEARGLEYAAGRLADLEDGDTALVDRWTLHRWAAEVRAGTRPVPGSPEPAGGGDDADPR